MLYAYDIRPLAPQTSDPLLDERGTTNVCWFAIEPLQTPPGKYCDVFLRRFHRNVIFIELALRLTLRKMLPQNLAAVGINKS